MQQAVKELAVKSEWRQKFMACGLGKPLDDDEIKSLEEWLAGDSDSITSHFKRIAYYILPAAALVTFGLLIMGMIPFSGFMLVIVCVCPCASEVPSTRSPDSRLMV